MKKDLFNILKLGLLLLLFFNIGYIFNKAFTLMGFDMSTFNYLDIAYINVLMELLLVIVLFFLYKKTLIDDYYKFKENYKKNILKCFVLFGILYGIKIGVAIVSSVLTSALGAEVSQSANQDVIDVLTGSAPLLMLLSSAILAPIAEEGIFRLGFYKIIKNKYLFIVISGLIFGFMHIFPTNLSMTVALIQSIIYVAMGISLAYIYAETKNIYFVIIVHAINNFLGLIAVVLLG